MYMFGKSAKKGKVPGFFLGDSDIYEGKDATGGDRFAASARKWFFERFQGAGVGLVPIRALIEAEERSIARTFGTEIQYLGDGATGSLALSQTKSKDFSIIVDQMVAMINREHQRKTMPYVAYWNNIDPDLIPNIKVESIQSAPTPEKIKGYEVMLKNGQIDPEDEIIDDFRAMIGFKPRSEGVKTRQVNQAAEDRKMFMQQQTANLNSQDSEDNK